MVLTDFSEITLPPLPVSSYQQEATESELERDAQSQLSEQANLAPAHTASITATLTVLVP